MSSSNECHDEVLRSIANVVKKKLPSPTNFTADLETTYCFPPHWLTSGHGLVGWLSEAVMACRANCLLWDIVWGGKGEEGNKVQWTCGSNWASWLQYLPHNTWGGLTRSTTPPRLYHSSPWTSHLSARPFQPPPPMLPGSHHWLIQDLVCKEQIKLMNYLCTYMYLVAITCHLFLLSFVAMAQLFCAVQSSCT